MEHEDTARLRAQQVTPHEQLRDVQQRLNAALDQLRDQREALNRSGMTLPGGTLDAMKTIRTEAEKAARVASSSLTELRQFQELARTASIISSSLDTAQVLNQVMDTVVRITGAERGYIALVDRQTGQMTYPVRRGIDQEMMEKGDLVVSSTIVNEVAQTGQGVLTENASKDYRFQDQRSVIGFQLRSILAVPLQVNNAVIGVVYCDNRIVDGLFKGSDLKLLQAFANQAAVAIENARLFERLQQALADKQQTRDLLTSLFGSIISGVVTLDRANTILDCNPAAEAVLGMTADEALGQPLAAFLTGVEASFDEALAEAQQAGIPTRLEIHPLLSSLGRRAWNVVISPLRGEEGEIEGAVIVIDDLTETRRREDQLGIASNYLKLKLENIRDAALDVAGQEREISVLHCDVRGFTSFSEAMDPQQLMEVINRYVSLSSDAINLYDGVVDKYMGDAVTGLFNTQFNPQDDHALRAVRAAMSMKLDLLALHETLPENERLFYGIGVHSGMAVLGNIGGAERKEFGALGDAPDLAKLLQENAERGEVLISTETYARVQEHYECEALAPRKHKGREDFTVMYRVLRHKRTGPLRRLGE